ncbi:MAG: hypothetical protein L6V84_03480 [Oscillospiraceae bacterium]|nr:MAG: hypothetical protein L6V84_03480 [Oscillospiraceae bacterium]
MLFVGKGFVGVVVKLPQLSRRIRCGKIGLRNFRKARTEIFAAVPPLGSVGVTDGISGTVVVPPFAVSVPFGVSGLV